MRVIVTEADKVCKCLREKSWPEKFGKLTDGALSLNFPGGGAAKAAARRGNYNGNSAGNGRGGRPRQLATADLSQEKKLQ